jgi:RHS repeat-associated protein
MYLIYRKHRARFTNGALLLALMLWTHASVALPTHPRRPVLWGTKRLLESTRATYVSLPTHFPTVDWSMNNPDLQSPTLCEVSCFAASYSFSTVPYYSLDQARNVTLVYYGDQATPRPFIYADVYDGGDGTLVKQYTLSATLNGAAVTFLNGLTSVTFAGPAYSGVTVRVAGQFDARSYSTDVYPLSVTMRVTYMDNAIVTKTTSTQIMIINEASSQIAKGWTVSGLQRLRATTAPGYMITNGDGSATRFSALGVVAADYSVLTYDSPSATYTRTYPDASRALFNASGTQISFIEANNLTTSYAYDANGRIQNITDPYRKQPNGTPTSIGLYYGANGIGGIQEPGPDGTQWMGRTTAFVVDSNRCLLSAEDPDHVLTRFTCDANGRLSTITDRKAGVTTLVYDPTSWKLSQTIEPQIAVDAGGGATTLVNPVINYSPWQTQTPSIVSSISASVTDPSGRVTRFVPNRFGQATDITDPTGLHTYITISGIRPTQITHSDGSVDTFMYDTRGRVTRSTPAGRSPTDYQYNSLGLLTVVSGLGARVDSLYYNSFNEVYLEVFTGTPRQTMSYTFDPSGTRGVATATDNAGHTTSYAYDPKLGNLATITIPGNRTTSKLFDAVGRDSVVTPAGLASQTTVYDVLNRVLSRTAAGSTMSYGYDNLFQTDFYDANNNHYHTDFNALGWPTNECDAFSACRTTRYDASGLPMSTTNRRGQLLSVTRDGAGRITMRSGAGVNTDNFSYSSNGHDMVAWNAIERDSIFVNPGSQSTAATTTVVSWIDGKRYQVYHRAPKAVADVDSLRITTNTGTTFNDRIASYTSSGFLSSFQVAPGAVISFIPNADGTGGVTTIPGGVSRTATALAIHSRDLVSFSNTGGPTLLPFGRRYHYDHVGRIDQAIQAQNGPANNPGLTFGYDTLGRLSARQVWSNCVYGSAPDSLSGTTTTCGTLVSTDLFTYDAMGNRTDHGGVPTTGNRYVVLNGGYYYYDADGNVKQKYKDQVYNYEYFWDAENQLDSTVYNGGHRTYFDYNAFGKPVREWDGLYSDRHIAKYLLWDGDALAAELDANGQRQVDYAYLPGTIDHPVAHTLGSTSPTTVRYHEVDALGNVIGTSQSGAVSQTNSYDAWGTVTYGGNIDQHLDWKGLYWNSDYTGLYYVRNRWYDPEGGRFVNEDPAGFAGGPNVYAYAGNDPINGRDPSGLDAYLDCYYTPGYAETTATGTITYAGYWTCSGGGGEDGGGAGSTTSGDGFHGGGGGGVRKVGASTPISHDPKWKSPACFVSAGLLLTSGIADAAYVAGVALAVEAGAPVLASLATVAVADAVEVEGIRSPMKAMVKGWGIQARNLGFSVIGAGFTGERPTVGQYLADMVPGVRTKNAFGAFQNNCSGRS